MKIAICISGDMRNYLQTHINQFENIFNQLDCDIFISSWEDAQTDWNQVISTYLPKALRIDRKTPQAREEKTIALGMYYKIFTCFQMVKESDQAYEAVIRMRPDSVFDSVITMPEIQSYLWTSGIEKKSKWVEDTFAFGSPHVMETYSSLYLDIHHLAEEIGTYHPETLLAHHLKSQGIPVKECLVSSGTLRDNGDVNSHMGYSGKPEGFLSLKFAY